MISIASDEWMITPIDDQQTQVVGTCVCVYDITHDQVVVMMMIKWWVCLRSHTIATRS